jgi:hypothetical protein
MRPRRALNGAIERACFDVIVIAGEPLGLRAIHAGVESRPETSVSYSSVKNAIVRLAARDEAPVERIARGVYNVDAGRG